MRPSQKQEGEEGNVTIKDSFLRFQTAGRDEERGESLTRRGLLAGTGRASGLGAYRAVGLEGQCQRPLSDHGEPRALVVKLGQLRSPLQGGEEGIMARSGVRA